MKRFRMNGRTGSRILTGVGLSLILLGSIIPAPKVEEGIDINTPAYVFMSYNTEKFRYLSDTPYIKEQSFVGYSTILLDRNIESKYNNGLITLNINGKNTSFIKGVSAHATSTLVYDLSDYNYDYFTSYIGVDASMGNNGNGVKFAIYTSKDGETWDLKTAVKPPVMKGTSEAMDVKIDIHDAKYLKLYCHNNGNDGSDHCVYANAKLVKEDYVPEDNQPVDFIKTVDAYDQILKGMTLEQQLTDGELTLLQREFVQNVGYDYLQMYSQYSEEFKEVVQWLMNDRDSLNLYIMGGKPAGSYLESLKVLVELYKNYRTDWASSEISKYGVVKGDVYKRMAFALSLTHSARVSLWMQPAKEENQSNAVVRYALFKQLYDAGKFQVTEDIDITKWFENYTVEEMRYVMNTALDDEEILWLHDYTQSQIDANKARAWAYLTPHPYMAYVWPNYSNSVFHDPERKEYWDAKFNGIFSKYGVTYSTEGNMVYKVWMNLRNEFGTGAVCGGISKTGSNIRAVHGIPAAVIGQPGHAAIIYYHETADGKGYWNIDNDVSGWTLSEKGERLPLGWGNDKRFVSGYNVPYIIMAQEALNRFSEYEKSAKLRMIANVYTDHETKEHYLKEALKSLDFNVDVWYDLIALYLNDSSKTEEDFYNLANEMSQALMEFPLPYYNLMAKIAPRFTSNAYKFKYSLLLTDTLNKGKVYNGTDVLQPSVTRLLASYLLGKTDTSLASFSFDGEDAGKIVLSDRFNGSGIRWDYSIDGKQTWHEVAFTAEEAHKHSLTLEELVNITEENDIYVHIVGVNYNEENLYKIDILKGAVSTSLYNNDLENRVVGVNSTYEWKFNDFDPWTSFDKEAPDLHGDAIVQVRVGATKTYLPSDAVTFRFTKDTDTDKRKYVKVEHLSIFNVSTEATGNQGHARNAIDANYNTRYHSAWNGTDTERYMTIQLDKPMYISAVEFVPAGGGNGKIYDGTIYGSMDGETWEVLTSQKGLTYTNQANTIADAIKNTKSFEISEPKKVQFIKIVADRTNGNWFTAREFNFFQDLTIQDVEPTPTITPEPTPSISPVPTPTATPEPTPSNSPVPTPTATPEPTPSNSPVPTPTATPEPTPSNSPVPTPTITPEPTPSISPVPTPTATPEPIPSISPVPTPTATPEPTPSMKPAPTATATPVPSPSNTPLPTIEPTFRPSVAPTPSASSTVKNPSKVTVTSSPIPSSTKSPVVRSTPKATTSLTPESKVEEENTTKKDTAKTQETIREENTKTGILDAFNDKKDEMQNFFAIILMIVAIAGILLIIF